MIPRTLWLLPALVACGSVQTHSLAPFALDNPRSMLWSELEDDGSNEGAALVVLSSEKIDCATVVDKPFNEAIFDGTRSGTGVVVLFTQSTNQGSLPAWEGPWTRLGAVVPSEAKPNAGHRRMELLGFADGLLYEVPFEGMQAELSDVDDVVRGAFDSQWWSGGFKADRCGEFSSGSAGY